VIVRIWTKRVTSEGTRWDYSEFSRNYKEFTGYALTTVSVDESGKYLDLYLEPYSGCLMKVPAPSVPEFKPARG